MRGSSDPTGALLLGLGAGLWSFFKGFRVMREYRILADTPRIPIRSVAMGFAHIRGKAESTQLLSSPVSRVPCCFYRVEIEEWKSHENHGGWKRCCVDFNGYRFYLADSTGKILIDTHAAEYDLPATITREVNSKTASPVAGDPELLQYVTYARLHSLTDRASQWIDKRMEKSAASNPQVETKREAMRELFAALPGVTQGGKSPIDLIEKFANASGPLSDPEQERKKQMVLQNLRLAGEKRQNELIGEFLPGEKSATGHFRLREFLVLPGQEYLVSGTCVECPAPEAEASGSRDRIMIAKGSSEPTFMISAQSDAQIDHTLRKRAMWMILGGAAVALASTAALLVHFGLF